MKFVSVSTQASFVDSGGHVEFEVLSERVAAFSVFFFAA
jgi:hypothetical protein